MDMTQSMPIAWTFSPLWVAAIVLVASTGR